MSTPVDRKQLLDLARRKSNSEKFAWGHQLDCSEFPSSILSFYVNELANNILVPITCKKLAVLAKVSEHAAKTQGLEIMDPLTGKSLHINPTKIKTKTSQSFMESAAPGLTLLAVRNLLGFDVDLLNEKIETNLVKLLLVEQGQHIQLSTQQENKPGTFAIMVLTIPVEGGYRGGKINVEHSQQKESFHFEEESDQHFSLVAFYSDCQHKLDPITNGVMVAMVFQLNWLDALKANTSPLEFPAFFKSFYEVSDLLKSWASPQSIVDEVKSESPEIDPATKEILLFFPLDEKYGNVEFSQLQGRDLSLARLFQSIGFLDVHIAVISQLIDSNQDHFIDWENHSDWTDRKFQISKWVGSRNSLPIISKEFQLDLQTQLVGNISRIHSVANGPDDSGNQVIYYHCVLVVQPRHQSVLHACRNQLEDVLTHMEIQLSIIKNYDRRPVVCQQLISTLKQVISFCSENPLWTEERSRRLLKLCIHLNAMEEGIDLLNLLGTIVPLNTSTTNAIPDIYVEGIRNDKMAKAVVDFALNVCGWETCSKSVVNLISPLRIFKQLAYFANLVTHLMNAGCVEGAQIVADRISSIVGMLDTVQHIDFLNDLHINAFVEMVIQLEDNISTAKQSRMDNVSKLFNRLTFIRQCQLIVTLRSNDPSTSRRPSARRKLLKTLCECLVSNDFHSHPAELILPLLRAIVQSGDIDLILLLVDKICLGPDNEEFLNSNVLLYSILASPDVVDMANRSRNGKAAVARLLDAGIKQLTEKISAPKTNDEFDVIRSNLATSFHLVLKLELHPDRGDSKSILSAVGFLIYSLSCERLCDIILDVWILAGNSLVNHPITYNAFIGVCRMLSLFDQDYIANLGKERILQLLKCVVWLEDIESTKSLIQKIHFNNNWNPEDKDALAESILSWQDVLDHLIPASSDYVPETIDTIIKFWVIKLTHRVESLEDSQDYSTDILDEEISYCVRLYLQNEKQYPHSPADYSIQLFQSLIEKLSNWRLSLLLAKIYPSFKMEENLSKYSGCFNFCRFVAQQLISRDLSNLLKSTSDIVVVTVVDVMIFLLWIGDDQSLTNFTTKICSLFSPWQENIFVSKMVANSESRKMAATCQASRKSFCILLDQRINRLKMIKARGSPVEQGNSNSILIQLEEARMLQKSLQEQSEISEENTLLTPPPPVNNKRPLTLDNLSITDSSPVKRERNENP